MTHNEKLKKVAAVAFAAAACCSVTYAQEQQCEWVDLTSQYIQNPSYDNNSTEGWQSWGWCGSINCRAGAFEYWYGMWDTYQYIPNLPEGHYRLGVQSYYRPGDYSLADYKAYHEDGIDNSTAYLYVEGYGEAEYSEYSLIANVYSEWLTNSVSGAKRVAANVYFPNTMESGVYCFGQGMYKNTLEFDHTGGPLYIGLKNDEFTPDNWILMDNWSLEWYGLMTRVEEIKLTYTQKEAAIGETFSIYAYVIPDDATLATLSWATDNPAVATVDKDGNVTAMGEGTANITASATDGSGVESKCAVTVYRGAATAENIVINEIMAANVDVYRDPSTNFGSWVELYNPTDRSVTLGGLYVSDDPENLTKHRLVDTYGAVPAYGFAVLNFDHYEIYTPKSVRQIDGKLDCDGGVIIISDGKNIIAQQEYPEAVSRISYARTQDGGDIWGLCGVPTPGDMNANGTFAEEQLSAPVVDVESQVLNAPIDMHVEIPEGATLLYTFDGSLPTMNNAYSTQDGKFHIESDYPTNIRLRLVRDGYLPSPVVTRSFVVAYNDDFKFPIVSVTTENSNIWSQEYGLYYSGENGRPGNGQSAKCNFNMDWDRPVHFDYIGEDGKLIFSQECNYSACGGWSRAWSPHSFKLKADKQFGANSFAYQFFDEKPYLKNKTLQIRNGGNDTDCRIKDVAIQRIVSTSGLNVDHQAWQPVHVVINGSHMGVLNMREPNNKHYASANYGIDTDEMDQFEINPDSGYVQKEGTDEAFLRWYDLSATAGDEASYEEIKKLVDIDEYINYMAVELYTSNWDWPQNNVKGFRDRNDGRFRFIIFDMDGALSSKVSNAFNTFYGKKNYTFDTLLGYDYANDKSLNGVQIKEEIKFVTIFQNMLQNDAFRKQFVDVFCLMAGSVFTPTRVRTIVNETATVLRRGGWIDPTYSASELINGFSSTYQEKQYKAIKSDTRMKLATTAVSYGFKTNVDGGRILMNGIDVPTGQFDGKLYGEVVVKAVPMAGYVFRGWALTSKYTIAKGDFDAVEYLTTESEYVLPTKTQKIIAVYEPFTAEDIIATGVAPVVVNEVGASNTMYVNDYFKKSDWIELYNTTAEDVDLAGVYLTDNADKPQKYQIPTDDAMLNTIIPAHGYKVIWADKNESIGADIHASFKLEADSGLVAIACYDGADVVWADALQYTAHSGTQSFGRYPDGGYSTYVFANPTLGNPNAKSVSDELVAEYVQTMPTAIADVADDAMPYVVEYYNVSGVRTTSPQKGINIVRLSNGKTRKIFVRW